MIRCNLTRAGRILRFSRSGEPKIEEAYSTHLVVVGKRNPFAASESDPALPDEAPEKIKPGINSSVSGWKAEK